VRVSSRTPDARIPLESAFVAFAPGVYCTAAATLKGGAVMTAPLEITDRLFSDVGVILTLSGSLMADEGYRLLAERVADVVNSGAAHVLLDLRDVGHIDSGGAGALATALLHVKRRGGELRLLCPSERVSRVLEVTRLLAIFEVVTSVDQAVRRFGTAARQISS
jgi:anti-anti-sigma factor